MRSLQGRVFHVTSLVAKNGAKQFLFRRRIGFPFRSDLSNKDVPLINLGADTDNTVFVQVLGSFLTSVRTIRSKFFFAAFGITDFQFKLLNVARSKETFLPETRTHDV